MKIKKLYGFTFLFLFFLCGFSEMAFRVKFEQGFGNWKLGMRYQSGLHDFQYQSVRLEISYYLSEDFLKRKKKEKL